MRCEDLLISKWSATDFQQMMFCSLSLNAFTSPTALLHLYVFLSWLNKNAVLISVKICKTAIDARWTEVLKLFAWMVVERLLATAVIGYRLPVTGYRRWTTTASPRAASLLNNRSDGILFIFTITILHFYSQRLGSSLIHKQLRRQVNRKPHDSVIFNRIFTLYSNFSYFYPFYLLQNVLSLCWIVP